jgi:hypothetical protein
MAHRLRDIVSEREKKGALPIMRRKKIYMAIIFVLAAGLPILTAWGSASAQSIQHDDVQRAIERTDEIIAEAKEIVSESRSQRARVALEHAINLQNRAKNSFSPTNSTDYRTAMMLTGEARKEAQRAIGLARLDTQQEAKFKRMSEYTTERLISLRTRMAESGVRDDRTMRLIEESFLLLDKARINYQQFRIEMAVKLTENANHLAIRAEERFRRMRSLKEMCERRLVLLDRLAERARERIEDNGNERAANQLHIAEENLSRARYNLSTGNYNACRINLERSEKILRNLIRHIQNGTGNAAGNILAETKRLLEVAEEMVADNPDLPPDAEARVERTREIIQRAETNIAAGRFDDARRLIEQARRLLRSALASGWDTVTAEQAEAEISRVRERFDSTGEMLGECDAEGIRNLYGRAEDHIRSALSELDGGRHERALVEARIARNLLSRIREICSL